MAVEMLDKRADLAGPGIGDYDEVKRILPQNYSSLLTPKETQKAIFAVKGLIEDNLCKEREFENAAGATGAVGLARFPEFPVPPSHLERSDPAHRRRHRAVEDVDAFASQGALGGGQCDRVAQDTEGDVREEEHLHTGVSWVKTRKAPAAIRCRLRALGFAGTLAENRAS